MDATLLDAEAEAAVLRVYRQIFAVLAREAGAMIVDPELLDVDQAILDAFAEAGSEGLTVEQATLACRAFPHDVIVRRFEVLRQYGAITKLVDRPNELRHRAAFAPYVMLMFLRRMSVQGGQAELHQLLTLEAHSVSDSRATEAEGQASIQRLTKVFRLLGNELAILVSTSTSAQLRENAQLAWGNERLIEQAEKVHRIVLERWPSLHQVCTQLRMALAAYADAVQLAAGRLVERAGTTRALGLLPIESWLTFTRGSDVEALASVLDGLLFDAAAPDFSPETMLEAVETGRRTGTARMAPPRPSGEASVPESAAATDREDLRAEAERVLAGRESVSIVEVVDDAGDWITARRILAELTAAHLHDELDYELVWSDGMRIDSSSGTPWATEGTFRRVSR
ncbi:hypothetical protein EV643_1407 [Kribbella sp. VKM Ac-2527]|uniref:Uncharacterized protein n=1 Tax=Kribbella caucasensis TaxID=2512215 RepID=A0A4R6J728_9ACTN|nr:hypothetical protein [Kribbella sp. VKM Ac-2527]TDO30176.1 hypothetical protein EV643_1407 [Kribbella sp. VKM Ac-2527]